MGTAVSLKRFEQTSPRLQARIAGFLYLIIIAGGIFAEFIVRGRLVVSGDAAATAHNILAHEMLYRLGFAAELFYCACAVPLTLLFYWLFKVVSKSAALLVAFFSLVGTAVESVSLLGHFALAHAFNLAGKIFPSALVFLSNEICPTDLAFSLDNSMRTLSTVLKGAIV
jgi:Domain of unknown function (DUF4386)